jgi:hypothetical protein
MGRKQEEHPRVATNLYNLAELLDVTLEALGASPK